ncbi:sulfatase-like hydrolase/transferase [Vibrio parahaemolyticus]|nr:sulfatase-like hydrolase/transferase [Vibrio parahaemolyticus]MDN4731777.1 sulfatase-like hydrolase/transferase [Vibrio parahaemolyticus]
MGSKGETSQWEPQLFNDTTPVEPNKKPEDGYQLNEDLVDNAIKWIDQQKSIDPEKPYFTYFAPGAVHAPLHAPKEWIDKFKGKFDMGWDKYREEVFARQKKWASFHKTPNLPHDQKKSKHGIV